MKIPLQQLPLHLTKSLASIYLVSGDETLLVEEAIQSICAAARLKGFEERVSLSATSSDWGTELHTNAYSLSLFSEKKIITLDLSSIKLSAANSKIIQSYAEKPTPDILLIVRLQKLDSKTEQTKWFQVIEKNSVIIPVWPITLQQLPAWIMQRSKSVGLQITARAAESLAQFCEGNLLAASQEIEKLLLLNISTTIDETTLAKIATDNAHFDIFSLVESSLAGNSTRSLHIINHLQAEHVEPALILWALTNEVRLMNTFAQQLLSGTALSALFSNHRIAQKRQSAIQQFLRRKKQPDCWELLVKAAEVDRLIKGVEVGQLWDSLRELVLNICYSH